MKKNLLAIFPALLCLGASFVSFAEPGPEIPLWPEGVPDEADLQLPAESSADKNNDGIVRVSDVSHPTIRFFPAPEEKNTGVTVMVCPGGGYSILAISHEGTQVCEWLNSIGVNAVLLKYRVPRRAGLEKHHAPLQDAQRALSLARKNAKEWKINPDQIGILGFSAGGHLSAATLTNADQPRTYPTKPEIDEFSCQPNFAILVYPAYLQSEDDPNRLPPEIRVTKDTPPVFLVAAHGDKAWAESSVILYLAMKRAGASAELHLFAKGGHGFGMKPIEEEVGNWPALAEKWMREMEILGGGKEAVAAGAPLEIPVGVVKGADHEVVLLQGRDGPLYSIRGRGGKELATMITREELVARFPEIEKQLRSAWAGNENGRSVRMNSNMPFPAAPTK